ncbi:MAG: hypothetical protein GPOALKHO_000563 [Sodalis sp.]|nr:MAG: hypothetical protein GPOALKHO_000563 [Sodalis sp.]
MHHLATQHGHRFALGRINFARHDGAARLVFRNTQLADSAAWTGRQPAHIVGDFHHRRRQSFQGAMAVQTCVPTATQPDISYHSVSGGRPGDGFGRFSQYR